ncbi:MAG: hypothetical protein NT062_20060, partial [Proteobacteria bacterium]|nr:hypothetical protein [Pseudomonadota bacterium]
AGIAVVLRGTARDLRAQLDPIVASFVAASSWEAADGKPPVLGILIALGLAIGVLVAQRRKTKAKQAAASPRR